MSQGMDQDWVMATLEDAAAALEQLIDEVDAGADDLDALLQEKMPAVFAKLNYAWNTRQLGPEALDTLDHDALIAWPNDAGL